MEKTGSLPKLVASDIGGTLADDVNTIPPFTVRVLNRLIRTNLPVLLITGYNYSSTKKFTENLDDRVILMPQNGSLCVKDGKLVWEYRIPEPQAKELCAFLRKNNLPIIIYKGKEADFDNIYVYPQELYLSYAFRRVERLTGYSNITGISTLLPDNKAAKVRKKIQGIVGDKFKIIYTRQTRGAWLEVVHPEVRKDLSLKRLCREMDIPLADVIYFGDNFNDEEALRIVGHPVLVENAAPELKKEFTTIIRPVAKEGAAHYLNEIFSLNIN
jgi:hypothetical protein